MRGLIPYERDVVSLRAVNFRCLFSLRFLRATSQSLKPLRFRLGLHAKKWRKKNPHFSIFGIFDGLQKAWAMLRKVSFRCSTPHFDEHSRQFLTAILTPTPGVLAD